MKLKQIIIDSVGVKRGDKGKKRTGAKCASTIKTPT